MAITLKRQLSESEKQAVLTQHGRKCFATGHLIPDGEPIHFDHIKAYSQGGPSEIDNIAPMCGQHNKEKGVLPLFDFRTKLRLQEFFTSDDKLTLRHLLAHQKAKGDISDFARPVAVSVAGNVVTIEAATKTTTHPAYTCPATGWHYFYATIDVELLDSDDDHDDQIGLQPRYLIFDKVFELSRHFQQHPVLQPSIGRVVGSHIRLFDGQHKVAALLWNGRKVFECKIYLDPDLRLLNQTNISAHDKFAQTRFYASVMVMKLGSQFGIDFEKYKNTENGDAKSETGFLEYLAKADGTQSRAERNQRFKSYLYDSILTSEENKLSRFVSDSNRSSEEKPLTMDLLSKSLFSCFLYREPTDDNMVTEAYKRDDEMNNVVMLMNYLYDSAMADWDPKAGQNDENQRRLDRIFRSKSMMAWSELLRDAICGKLELQDAEDRAKPFYRKLTDTEAEQVKKVVNRLTVWKGWLAPKGDDIERVLSDNKSEVKEWLRKKGLSTGYLMGAPH